MKKLNEILKPLEIVNKDLTSGNFFGLGLGYPNVVDWDKVNTWSTQIWRTLTGDREHIFYVTPGTSSMLSLLAGSHFGKMKTQEIYMLAPYYSGAYDIFSERNNVTVFDTLDAMCEALRECNVCGFVYVVPNFRNPDGYTMTEEEVQKLIEACRVNMTLIVEDDPYFFLNTVVDGCRFLDRYEYTLHLNSFSKCIGAPGMRVGCFACSDIDLEKRIWEDMMKKFIYPDPSKILFMMKNWSIEKIFDYMNFVKAEIEKRQAYFNFEGFYLWKKKDEKYHEMVKKGFKMKEGALFGEAFGDYYRASLAHVPSESAEYAVLKDIFLYD